MIFQIVFWTCTNKSLDDRQKLESSIKSEINNGKGTFAVAWKDLTSGEEILINEDTVFHAASTMKTPVMIEVFKQASANTFHLTDSITVSNQFYSIVDSSMFSLSASEDSEPELYNVIGGKKTIYDLVYQMIIRSSNLATNIIIGLIDARKVTETMRSLGAGSIQVLRGVEDIKAYEAGLNNSTTALDLLKIYTHLASGDLIDKSSNQAMIDILLDQIFNDIIPAYLPEEVIVAHKTGNITGVHHDSGIVFLPNGRRYVIVLLSKNLEDFDHGTETLARISRLIYDYYINTLVNNNK